MIRAAVVAQFRRYLDGELSGPMLEKWLVESRALEEFLGPDEYQRLLVRDYVGQERAAWSALRDLMGEEFPEALLAERARRTCEGLLEGSMHLLAGVRAMRSFPQGTTGAWTRLDKATADIPLPEHRRLWSEEALTERLERLEKLRPEILQAARAFLSKVE